MMLDKARLEEQEEFKSSEQDPLNIFAIIRQVSDLLRHGSFFSRNSRFPPFFEKPSGVKAEQGAGHFTCPNIT